LTSRPGDFPEGGDARLQNMEHVVLKPQNLREQLHLFPDSPPAQGCPSISDLMMEAEDTDPPPGKILEAIRMKNGLHETTIEECIENEGQIKYRANLYVPGSDELRLRVIQEHHVTALAGHPGRAKTFDLLDRGYYGQVIRKDVDWCVRNCHDYRWSQSSRHSTFGVLQSLPLPNNPWEDISMDFVVGFPECEEFDAIWVVVDRRSKMQHVIPCNTTIVAPGLAELFLREVVRLHGLPLTIISDQGVQTVSTVWQQVFSRLGIDRRMSTSFHPLTDGQTERMNATMEWYLRVFVNHQQDDWLKWLPLAEFAANNAVSETSKFTPFNVIQGTDPQMALVGEPTQEQDQRRVNADEVQATLQQNHEHLRLEIRRSQAVQKEGSNRGPISASNFQEGCQVWLDTRLVGTIRPTRELDWKRLGPFRVVRRVSPYEYELELPAWIRIHTVQPVSLLDPVANDPLRRQQVSPPPSVEVDGEEEYQVSSVEDSCMYRNQLQCLIRWTGCDSLSWEPAKCVDGLQAVGEFHQRYPGTP